MYERITDKIKALKTLIPLCPFAGRTYFCDFGEWSYHMHYLSESRALLSFSTGVIEEVSILAIQLRPELFMVHWQEADSSVITQVQDHSQGSVWTVTTFHRGILHRQGTFREVFV